VADKQVPLSIVLRMVDKASAGMKSFDEKIGKTLDKISKKVVSAGKAMSTHLTLPIVGGFALATRSLATFEKGMGNVSTLIDSSTEDLGAMGKAVLAIGRRTPVALEDLTGALYEARSAGVSASDQFRVLEKSARLAVAGLGSTNEAVDLVTSSINAFGLKGEEANRVYDVIFKTAKFGKTTIAGLSRGFGSVAGTVAASNIKLDEYLASVAALTTTGLPASEAHTQLRAVIAGLTRTTDKTRIVFGKLGSKDFKDLIAKSGGLVPALGRINKLLKGNSSMTLELLGSTEALNAVIGLTGGQAAVFTDALADMRQGANAVDVAFDKQNKTMVAGMTRTKNALTSVGISVGKILAPALEKLSGWLQRATEWFEKLNPSTKEWIVHIAAVAAVVGPAVIVLGKLTAAVRVLGLAFTAMSNVGVAGTLALGRALAVVSLKLAAITAAIIAAQKAWEFFNASTGERTGSSSDLLAEGKLVGGTDRVIRPALPGEFERTMPYPWQRQRAEPQGIDSVVTQAPVKISVDFKNVPRGTRVNANPGSAGADVDLNVGYQLGVTP
jgi:TP901 family phage tail tape measure protein